MGGRSGEKSRKLKELPIKDGVAANNKDRTALPDRMANRSVEEMMYNLRS